MAGDPSQGREPDGKLNDHGLAQQLKELFRSDNNDDVLQKVQMLHSESARFGEHSQTEDAPPQETASQQQRRSRQQ